MGVAVGVEGLVPVKFQASGATVGLTLGIPNLVAILVSRVCGYPVDVTVVL